MLLVGAGSCNLNGVLAFFPGSENPSLFRTYVVPSRAPVRTTITDQEQKMMIPKDADPRRRHLLWSREHGKTLDIE